MKRHGATNRTRRVNDEDDREEDEVHIELQVTDLTSSGSGSSGDSCCSDDHDERHHDQGQQKPLPQSPPVHQQAEEELDELELELELRVVQHHHQQHEDKEEDTGSGCLERRQRCGLLVATIPLIFFSFEMIPSLCQSLCLQDEEEMDAYFFTAAFLGGLGAVLYGASTRYWHARFIGGAIAALGSLFTNWMLLSSVGGGGGGHGDSSSSSSPSSMLAIVFGLIGMLVGAMPGFLAYFIVKIVSDECYMSDIFTEDYIYDDYEYERSPLTVPLASPLASSGGGGIDHRDDEFVVREPTI